MTGNKATHKFPCIWSQLTTKETYA